MYPQANPVWNAFLPSPRLNAYEVFDSGHVAVTVCIYLVHMMFFLYFGLQLLHTKVLTTNIVPLTWLKMVENRFYILLFHNYVIYFEFICWPSVP